MSVCAGSRGSAGAPRAKPGPARDEGGGGGGGRGGGGGWGVRCSLELHLSVLVTQSVNMPTHTVRLKAGRQHHLSLFLQL